jgi:Rrf2 family cysteine metabolism transcriptional repressor
MVDLAQHYAEGPVTLKAIAELQELSAKYVEQLIIPLRAAGLIQSVRGR